MAFRWNYKTAFLRCALLLAVGTTLQLSIGDVPSGLLRYPWGAVLAANYLYLIVLAYALSDKSRWLRSLWDSKACVSSLAVMMCLVIVSGFYRITASWPFNLMLLYFMTALGIRTVSEVRGMRNIARTAMHAGVFFLLWAGFFGSGDKVRCKVTVPLGIPVSMAQGNDGKGIALPFTLTLKEFSIDEYPPKLYLADTGNGSLSEQFIYVEDETPASMIGGWRLTVDTCLTMAGCMPGDSVFRAMKHAGAVPAVYVTAVQEETGRKHSGWVSCGSHIFSSRMLSLGDVKAVFMPRPEAKRYYSRVSITDTGGNGKDYDIEVNHPARYGSWRIYQAGYDTARGRWSSVSVLECVRDPWYFISGTALWLILVSGAALALSAGGKRMSNKKGRGR